MKKLQIVIIVYLVLFQFVVFASEPFRFVLFTDLHISATSQTPAQDLRNAVNDVNALPGIDFVLVTGDVANLGDTVSLIEAKRLLKWLKMPFYIIPGNHDFHWNINKGAADFIHVFGDDKFIFIHKDVVFVGFTTAPLNKSGNGFIQPTDIEWVKNRLSKEGKSKPAFVVTHYPLLTGDVDNWKDLTDLLHQFNVKAILCGHYHRNVLLNFDGIPGIVNRTTQRTKNSVGGYSIYTVSDSLTVSEKRIGEAENVWLKLPLESK